MANKQRNDDITDVVILSPTYCSGLFDDDDDDHKRKKHVGRRFWVHDVIRQREVHEVAIIYEIGL